MKVELVTLTAASEGLDGDAQAVHGVKSVWVTHNFAFLGGSLGCAEGEKIARAFEYALENKLPICVQCKTGGARMQEGTSSLMQMAKVCLLIFLVFNPSIS